MSESLYELLGVTANCSPEQLRKAYKRAAVKAHPDKGGNQEQFHRVKEAFELLKEPRLRQLYDTFGLQAALTERERLSNRAEVRRRVKPPEMVCELAVDLEELYCGKTKQVKLPKYQSCTQCNGACGTVALCMGCSGRGFVSNRACRQCQGNGRHYAVCIGCGGQGAQVDQELVSVPVPAGARDGQSIRLEGRGIRLAELDSVGDMLVILREKPHSDLRRVPAAPQDLFIERTVSLAEAMHGVQLPFTHLDGRRLMLSYSGVVQPEQVLRLKGQGMPISTSEHGDLLVRIHVQLPKQPSAELLATLPIQPMSTEGTEVCPLERVKVHKQKPQQEKPIDCITQ